MPKLDNIKHEKFAQALSKGLTLEEAHREAGYSGSRSTAHALASQKNISERLEELKQQAEKECRLTKKQLLDYLCDIIETPAGEVTKTHKLCQSFKDTEKESEIRIPSKLDAVQQLVKMLGWNEPEKKQIGVDDELANLLLTIRRGK